MIIPERAGDLDGSGDSRGSNLNSPDVESSLINSVRGVGEGEMMILVMKKTLAFREL